MRFWNGSLHCFGVLSLRIFSLPPFFLCKLKIARVILFFSIISLALDVSQVWLYANFRWEFCGFYISLSSNAARCLLQDLHLPQSLIFLIFFRSLSFLPKVFLSFQWDILLLEAGFIAIWYRCDVSCDMFVGLRPDNSLSLFFSPMLPTISSQIAENIAHTKKKDAALANRPKRVIFTLSLSFHIWHNWLFPTLQASPLFLLLLRLLLFKLMFMSGVVKVPHRHFAVFLLSLTLSHISLLCVPSLSLPLERSYPFLSLSFSPSICFSPITPAPIWVSDMVEFVCPLPSLCHTMHPKSSLMVDHFSLVSHFSSPRFHSVFAHFNIFEWLLPPIHTNSYAYICMFKHWHTHKHTP